MIKQIQQLNRKEWEYETISETKKIRETLQIKYLAKILHFVYQIIQFDSIYPIQNHTNEWF